MVLMIVAVLIVLGLCFGSFVNALVWRVHEQDSLKQAKKPTKAQAAKLQKLSISQGRSMCTHCGHELAAKDLVPVLSWLTLGGRCRYCHKPISVQYPVVEAATAALFVASYVWWPVALQGTQIAVFAVWLVLLIGLMALLVYDLRWMLLPDRLVFPLTAVAALMACLQVLGADAIGGAVLNTALAVLIGGGIFYLLFQLSAGKWIGGGDVKLGWLLGLIVGTPAHSFLMLFLAALLGSLVSLPLMATRRLKSSSHIPFGPFLIVSTIIVVLFGTSLLAWYSRVFLTV